jgi:hypothetical protein
MSARTAITRGQFQRVRRVLTAAQREARALSRSKRLLKETLPADAAAWTLIDVAVLSGESARSLISRFGLRLKNK